MNIIKELKYEKQQAEIVLKKAKKDIEKYEEKYGDEKLVCSDSHKIPQYFLNGKYVPKSNTSTLEAIAQLDYGRKVEKSVNKKIMILDKAISLYENDNVDSVYTKLCRGRKALVKPYTISKEDYIENWLKKEFTPYDRWDDVNNEFYTSRGERVRSKSELIIANELLGRGIPYKYEMPLTLLDGEKEYIVRPDFTVLHRRTLKEIVIEHLGMMDNQGYYTKNLDKISLYEKNGFLLGKNLLILHETSNNPLNMKVVKKYFDEYLE